MKPILFLAVVFVTQAIAHGGDGGSHGGSESSHGGESTTQGQTAPSQHTMGNKPSQNAAHNEASSGKSLGGKEGAASNMMEMMEGLDEAMAGQKKDGFGGGGQMEFGGNDAAPRQESGNENLAASRDNDVERQGNDSGRNEDWSDGGRSGSLVEKEEGKGGLKPEHGNSHGNEIAAEERGRSRQGDGFDMNKKSTASRARKK